MDQLDEKALLKLVVLPSSIANRSANERGTYTRKALQNEITTGGIQLLRRKGQFGSLERLFPDEARRWTDPIGVDPKDCFAFRLDRLGARTEVVFFKPAGNDIRLIRVNNVTVLGNE